MTLHLNFPSNLIELNRVLNYSKDKIAGHGKHVTLIVVTDEQIRTGEVYYCPERKNLFKSTWKNSIKKRHPEYMRVVWTNNDFFKQKYMLKLDDRFVKNYASSQGAIKELLL